MTKIQIFGVGIVGSTIASLIISKFKFVDLILTDTNKDLLYSQFYELKVLSKHINPTAIIKKSSDVEKADIYIICCGKRRKKEQPKIELFEENWNIIEPIIEEISLQNNKSWTLIVTNPPTALSQKAMDYIPRVIPIGLITDDIEKKLLSVSGSHEYNDDIDIGEQIFEKKGYTNFGVSGEVINTLNTIIST